MASRNTFDIILGEIGQALLPLRTALQSPEEFFAFALQLGWQADDLPQPLRDLGAGVETLYTALRRHLGDDLNIDGAIALVDEDAPAMQVNPDDIARVAHAVEQIIAGIRAIAQAPDAAIPPAMLADGFKTQFPKQLIDHLIIRYVTTYHPSVAFALRALGVIKTTYVEPTGNRVPYMRYTLDLADLPKTLSNPASVLEHAFGWGRDDFDHGALISQIDNLLSALRIDVRVEDVPTSTALAIEGGEQTPESSGRRALRAVLVHRPVDAGVMTAEVQLLGLPGRDALKPGLALMPSFNGDLDSSIALDADTTLTLESDLDLQGGVALLIRPDRDIDVLVGFNDSDAPVASTGSILARIQRTGGDKASVLLGAPDTTRLQFEKIGGAAGMKLTPDGDVDVFAEAELHGLRFVFDPKESDGFISRILPDDGIGFATDLTVGVSQRDGFYFRGSSNLEIAIPAHLQVGPIDIQSLTIAASPRQDALPISLGATFAAKLGPVRAVIERIGLTATFTFAPEYDGNLGPLDLSMDFMPPSGVALAIDAGVVKGGGFLSFDRARGEYAGAIELTFSEFLSLKAIGLIATKMPDGSKGFSLLIAISAGFGSGLQLGFGFRLLEVGGLLGLNRGLNLQALVEGVRTGAIESVMFPKDIIANAPKILSDLRAFFPARDGTFLIGPMAKLAWGARSLVTATIGFIIEIPGRIAMIGVVRVAVRAGNNAVLLQVQANFVGAIEFGRKRAFFFAALFDSRILSAPIDAEMGLLVAWGDDANVVISVGGFHPRFTPPPLPFPAPRRVSIGLLNSSNARVRLDGYLAVTANTMQFGARVEVFFRLSKLTVEGHLAFDALFQFSPFAFIIDFSASFSVKVFGIGLFSVRVEGSLSGPTPWHIEGKGKIKLLFWSIKVPIEKTWGDRHDAQLPPISVMPLVREELTRAESWRALPPASSALFVTMRKMPAEEAALILHPLGVLRISQRAVPLGLTLDRVGSQKPADVNRVAVEVKVTTGGLAKKDDAFESFAPGQFQDFEDAQLLSRPGFVQERSGVHLAAKGADLQSSVAVKRLLRYEEIIVDSSFKRSQRRFTEVPGTLSAFFAHGASVSRSSVSHASKRALQPFAEKVAVTTERYTVAFQSNNQPFASDADDLTSEASARDYMRRKIADNPSLVDVIHVIPSVEKAA